MACIVHGRRQNSLLLPDIQGYAYALHEGIQGSVRVSCVACLDAAKLGVPQRAADFCRLCNRHIRKSCLHRPAACSAQRQVGDMTYLCPMTVRRIPGWCRCAVSGMSLLSATGISALATRSEILQYTSAGCSISRTRTGW